MNSDDLKFKRVIEKNTFYFFNQKFEEEYEGTINSIKELLLLLRNDIQTNGLRKEPFIKLLAEKENGLKAILALTGLSNENLKRIITLIRVVNDRELNELVNKEKWFDAIDNLEGGIGEWTDSKIKKMVGENEYFRRGLINLFFEGATIPLLSKTLPLFEIKKLSVSKLNFEIPGLVDTLIRYREKGSYSGKAENNPETVIRNILNELEITFESGDLTELIKNAPSTKRTMDFIIPSKVSPIIIAESSYLVTTSSGQGDKSKTEISIRNLIAKYYPKAKFIGFIDGIGWYVRKGDLKRMVSAYDEVFTFHIDELHRFKIFLQKVIYEFRNYK